MKRHIRNILLILAAAAAAFTACFRLSEIIVPADIQTNQDIEIHVKGSIKPETTYGPEGIAFAMLVPSAWKMAQNAEITISTQNLKTAYGVDDLVDEPMIPISDELLPKTTGTAGLEIYTGLTWAQAYYLRNGDMGNKGGDVEWLVFTNKNTKVEVTSIKDENYRVEMDVKIKFNTGAKPVKWIFACEFAGEKEGWEGVGYRNNLKSQLITVGDGSLDYTALPLTSTVPSTFRYGDFFAVQFVTEVDGERTALYGAKDIYMVGTAVLADGTVVTVDRKDNWTRMTNTSDTSYKKYIFPRHFFGLDKDAEIKEIYFYFSNKDASRIVRHGSGYGYYFEQAAE
ncbi:MAG: DUF4961 domain-containing protein [Bacteroidales bacterium]|nr:DUF4961 domain-containing protein [Bacteroidales bacterium]